MASVTEVVNARCCGLDVHKETVVACVRTTGPGGTVEQEVRTFATTTRGLLELGDWLSASRVTIVAMESTGVYWKPVWNLLEGRATVEGELIQLMLVNARHVKNVPGRKTDVKDCQWIAQLLAAGLAAVGKLDRIPGFDRRAAQNVLAEIGTDMTRFPTQGHLASWAGLCPGNNQSAGKRKSGHMTEGNKWLKRTLNQTAWAGSRTKASYFKAQFQRLTKRRGAKRAAMAVAHSQLGVIYQMLKRDVPFEDLGVDYFDTLNSDRLKRQLIAKLQRLGCKVTIENTAA